MTEPDQEPTRYCNECCHDALEEVLLSRQAANDRVAELERQLASRPQPTGSEVSACCPGPTSDDDGIAALKRAQARKADPKKPTYAEIALTRERDEARSIATRLVKAMILWGAWEDGVPEPGCYGKNNEDAATAFDDAVRLIPDWRKQGR